MMRSPDLATVLALLRVANGLLTAPVPVLSLPLVATYRSLAPAPVGQSARQTKQARITARTSGRERDFAVWVMTDPPPETRSHGISGAGKSAATRLDPCGRVGNMASRTPRRGGDAPVLLCG